jgi:hypothetical protein
MFKMLVLKPDTYLGEQIIRRRGQLENFAVERLAKISLKQAYAFPPEPR